MKVKVKKTIIALAVIFISIFIIIFSEQASLTVVKSINTCLDVIIPSTFIFMVISSYILSNELYKVIFLPFLTVLKKILKLNERQLSVFLLSLIGGYPIGLKLLKEEIAENKNYHEIAVKCSSFCYCISPTFAITMLGLGLYQSVEAGLIIYFSNIITCFLIAFIYSRLFKIDIKIDKKITKNNQSGIIDAINDSSISLLKMCTVIIFFNTVITVLECFINFIGIQLPNIIKPIFEISNVLNIGTLTPSSLPFVSSLASFGGLCVIFQCKSLVGNAFSFKHFYISRLFASVLSFIAAKIILQFWDISIETQTGSGLYTFNFSQNKIAVFFLLIMFIIMLQKSEKNFKKG